MNAFTTAAPGVLARSWSEAIRGHMNRQRISGFVLAAKIGVSQNYLAKRLRDVAPLTLNDVEAISCALGVPAATFALESAVIAKRLQAAEAYADLSNAPVTP